MRVVNRVLAVAAALAAAVGGFLVAAEILLARIGREPWIVPYDDWYGRAIGNRWDAAGPRWLFMALCLGGLVIIALQVRKPAPRSIRLESGRSEAGVARRNLERALVRTVQSIDGVADARASVDRHRARIVVGTTRRTGDLRPAVEQAVQDRMRSFRLARDPKIMVGVKKRAR